MLNTVRLLMCAALLGAATFVHAQSGLDQPLSELPYSPGLDTRSMDRNADPCTDFYQYVCGGWIQHNPIPADQAKWDVYRKLAQDNQRYLWGILQTLAKPAPTHTPAQQQLGNYFAACMNESVIEQRGAQPLQAALQLIDGLRSRQQLPDVLGRLHHSSADDGLFFGLTANQDFADSTRVIAFANAGGLGLPDRDYYLKTDAKSQTLRQQYAAHIARLLSVLGTDPQAAAHAAQRILRIETALAQATLTRVQARDPYQQFHKMSPRALQALTPGFAWPAYFQALGMAAPPVLNVSEPRFYQALARQWQVRSLSDIQAYLRWHVAKAAAPFLSTAYAHEHFDFYSKTLRGIPEQQPRWKRCVAWVDNQLGEALGAEFVARTFSPELKDRTLRMAQQVEQAMAQDIAALAWMSAPTKQKALAKLHTVVNKVGYPERWRDYRAYVVKDDDFFGNVQRGNAFEMRRQLAKIGQPLDRDEWGMTPPTVNAYYNAQMNDINFPAGILQPPLFDARMDDAPNYGNTGSTIGHELTHGFDDEGRQFDAQGNLKDWWTAKDAKAFTQRAQCIVEQYAQYTIVDDLKINSKLTLGEDVADLGGLVLAWMAWQAQVANARPPSADGLTPEQRFFVGYGQWACEAERPESLRVKALTDPHSPGKYRINGTVSNLPEFAQAFACKPGQPMVRAKPCRVW